MNGFTNSIPKEGDCNVIISPAYSFSSLKKDPLLNYWDIDSSNCKKISTKIQATPIIPKVICKVITKENLKEIESKQYDYDHAKLNINVYTSKIGHTLNSITSSFLRIRVNNIVSINKINYLNGYESIDCKYLEIDCETLVTPPSSSVASFKGFLLKANAQQYTELKLDFGKIIINDILGLPQGMIFDGLKIKGAPIVKGYYNLIYKLNDGTSVPGVMYVSGLQRLI